MNKSILIIDDIETQAEQLKIALQTSIPNFSFFYASKEEEIQLAITGLYYNLAIVDLRMDSYAIDGFDIIDQISAVNPYAKVVAVSAYSDEYADKINSYLLEGKIIAISKKEKFEEWIPELQGYIDGYFKTDNTSVIAQTLENLYAESKNEQDTYKKGVMFENFVVVLFRHMGFEHIFTRVIDEARNEKDIVVRNDIKDFFFLKFGKYIYAECKNKPESGFDKNDFTVFDKKVSSSYGECDLGVVFTTGHIKKTVYKEALKSCQLDRRIMYVTQPEIQRLIHAGDILEEFKRIIDEQDR